jgi:hypothetical protein
MIIDKTPEEVVDVEISVNNDSDDDSDSDNQPEIISSYQIDNGMMQQLKEFYDDDEIIQTCRERKKEETLRHPCTIAWWFDEKVMIKEVPILNDKLYMKALHDMMWVAQDYLTLFHYVALYYVKDMAAWLARRDGSLPFGVVQLGINRNDNLGKFFLQRREGRAEKELVFVCSDEALAKRCDFYVFNEGANFKSFITRNVFSTYGDEVGEVVPLSAFTSLRDDNGDIYESKVCLFDANFSATHPEAYIVSKPPPDTQIENVSDDIRFALDDIGHGRSYQSYDKAQMSSNVANRYRKKFIQSHGARGTNGYPNLSRGIGEDEEEYTLYHERQAAFPHPSSRDTMVEMPNYMEIVRGPAPVSLIKPEDLTLRYEHKVCNLMNFPYTFFKASSNGFTGSGGSKSSLSGGGAGNGGLLFAQHQLEGSICKQQAVFSQIFSILYGKTFARLDEQLFNSEDTPLVIKESRDKITVKMKFDTKIKKTDESIRDLLPYMQHDVLTKNEVRAKVLYNYGIIADDDGDGGDIGDANITNGGDEEPPKKKRKVANLIKS